jgi:DNA-directed RNA polymerase specialized sigma24 family protein
MQEKVPVQTDQLNIPRSRRRRPAPPLEAIAAEHPERNAAIVAAYATGAYSYREIADHFGLHPATVGRVIRSRMLSFET